MRKHASHFIIFLLFVGILIPFQVLAQNRSGLNLKETFELYVSSIQNSDIESLFTTVTDNPELFFLTSTGNLIDTRQGYYEFHEEWFKEEDWDMPVELLEAVEGKEYGYTLAVFHYRGKTPQGGDYFLDSYFTLIFHKEDRMWKVVGDICTPIDRRFAEPNSDIKYSEEQEYIFNIIKSRRTVRKFKSDPVPEEHILKILDAARFAATAGNQQPWRFLVVQDRKKLDLLEIEALKWYLERYSAKKDLSEEEIASMEKRLRGLLKNVLSAPVYVAVLVDSEADYPDYIHYDGTLAAGNLMIAARALGYGTGFFTSFFPEDKMREFFRIPLNYKLICFTPIGIPEEWPETPSKKKLENLVVFDSF